MIDWQKVVLNIRAKTGLSMATIARRINSTEQHMNRIARGEVAEPRFNTGVKLLDLHYDVMGEDRHQEVLLCRLH